MTSDNLAEATQQSAAALEAQAGPIRRVLEARRALAQMLQGGTDRAAFQGRPSLTPSSSSSSEARTYFDRAIEAQERQNAMLEAETRTLGLNDAARRAAMEGARLATYAVQSNTRAGLENTAVTAAQQRKIDEVTSAYLRQATALERAQQAQRQSLELQHFIGQEMVSSIGGLISGTQKLNDVLLKLVQNLANAALQAAFLGEGPLAGIFGTGSTNPRNLTGGLIGSLFSALFPKVGFVNPFGGAKASGGPVEGGTPYLVGEAGPELFVPGGAGMVLPNAALRGGAPTVALTMVNDFRGADPGTEARLNLKLQQLRAEIPGVVVKTVQTAQQNRFLRA